MNALWCAKRPKLSENERPAFKQEALPPATASAGGSHPLLLPRAERGFCQEAAAELPPEQEGPLPDPVGSPRLREGLLLTRSLQPVPADEDDDDDDGLGNLFNIADPEEDAQYGQNTSTDDRDMGVVHGVELCWGTTQTLVECVLDMMDQNSALRSGLPADQIGNCWQKMQHCCIVALDMLRNMSGEKALDKYIAGAQELQERVATGHGMFALRLEIADHLEHARCVFVSVLDRTDLQFSTGVAHACKARRVLVTCEWLQLALGRIKDSRQRSTECNTHQKIIFEEHEIADGKVMALRTQRAREPYEQRTAHPGEDTTPIDLQPFLTTLPAQRKGGRWAICFLELNWDYALKAERYKLQEGAVADRIQHVISLLSQIAATNFASLRSRPDLYMKPHNYMGLQAHCPVAIWLKHIESRREPPVEPPRQAQPQPQADTAWSSWKPHAWNWTAWPP